MEEQSSGERLTTKDACRQFPETVPRQTLEHWMRHGAKNRHTGEIVLIEYEMHGARPRFTREAISRFIKALQKPEPAP